MYARFRLTHSQLYTVMFYIKRQYDHNRRLQHKHSQEYQELRRCLEVLGGREVPEKCQHNKTSQSSWLQFPSKHGKAKTMSSEQTLVLTKNINNLKEKCICKKKRRKISLFCFESSKEKLPLPVECPVSERSVYNCCESSRCK